jgi:hypothetical protein
MPITPAIQELEVGRSQSEAGPGKSVRSYLKQKLKAKGLGNSSNSRALAWQP